MKRTKILYILLLPLIFATGFVAARAGHKADDGYLIEHENDIKRDESGPHSGGGNTTAFPFFSQDKSLKIAFRKRILHPGSAIGYHLQQENEIYYIMAGKGILQMNGKDIPVSAGDAILTKPGSSHGLKPAGNEDLTVMIVYDI